ncbi:MAG: hypothetical protein KF753_05075 [Caldilineaceae bacterium]|nr:hypothetical protein [Caldilineaceae bacterium]
MINLPKVRYAVIVAIIGLAVALIPGLTDALAEVIRWLSVGTGALLVVARIAVEFIDSRDPMIYTQGRVVPGEPLGFWEKIKRAW